MKFFVHPFVGHRPEISENEYSSIKQFISKRYRRETTNRRIYKITYRKDDIPWLRQVGKKSIDDTRHVIAILYCESPGTYFVCKLNRDDEEYFIEEIEESRIEDFQDFE